MIVTLSTRAVGMPDTDSATNITIPCHNHIPHKGYRWITTGVVTNVKNRFPIEKFVVITDKGKDNLNVFKVFGEPKKKTKEFDKKRIEKQGDDDVNLANKITQYIVTDILYKDLEEISDVENVNLTKKAEFIINILLSFKIIGMVYSSS